MAGKTFGPHKRRTPQHVIKRHSGRVESIVALELDVPRSWLRRSRKGLWDCPRDIPPDCIQRVLTFQQLAGSAAA
jgi:hypothetical protein